MSKSSQKKILKNLLKKLEKLAEESKKELIDQGYKSHQIEIKRYLNLRYQGTDSALMIQDPNLKNKNKSDFRILGSRKRKLRIIEKDPDYITEFIQTYKREYGFELKNRDIVVDDLRVRGIAKSGGLKKFKLT